MCLTSIEIRLNITNTITHGIKWHTWTSMRTEDKKQSENTAHKYENGKKTIRKDTTALEKIKVIFRQLFFPKHFK